MSQTGSWRDRQLAAPVPPPRDCRDCPALPPPRQHAARPHTLAQQPLAYIIELTGGGYLVVQRRCQPNGQVQPAWWIVVGRAPHLPTWQAAAQQAAAAQPRQLAALQTLARWQWQAQQVVQAQQQVQWQAQQPVQWQAQHQAQRQRQAQQVHEAAAMMPAAQLPAQAQASANSTPCSSSGAGSSMGSTGTAAAGACADTCASTLPIRKRRRFSSGGWLAAACLQLAHPGCH